jgi:hypothetical protein
LIRLGGAWHLRWEQQESIEVSAKATLGLVLSGGGARGIAHIGVIDVLRSHGLEPDSIAGSSSGAIIGALTAAGHSTETMLGFFHKASPFRLSAVTVRKAGILDTAKVVASFREYFPDDSFEALKIRLFLTATDIINARLKIFESGRGWWRAQQFSHRAATRPLRRRGGPLREPTSQREADGPDRRASRLRASARSRHALFLEAEVPRMRCDAELSAAQ